MIIILLTRSNNASPHNITTRMVYSLRLRKAYWALREEWTGGDSTDQIVMPSCARVTKCPNDCSARGRCETDQNMCGPATSRPNSGAPCCVCAPGWAGVECEELDARTTLSLVCGFGLLALIACVFLSSGAPPVLPTIAAAARPRRRAPLAFSSLRNGFGPRKYATQYANGMGMEQGLLQDHKLLVGSQVSPYGSGAALTTRQ
ncbi:hypothetical protein T492DRAFT_417528 [Pavlovales sp. CCMP2436]|nr:hypothetical protein T492DRAFT_417528 [Pavlovales sp. CCMP2436]